MRLAGCVMIVDLKGGAGCGSSVISHLFWGCKSKNSGIGEIEGEPPSTGGRGLSKKKNQKRHDKGTHSYIYTTLSYHNKTKKQKPQPRRELGMEAGGKKLTSSPCEDLDWVAGNGGMAGGKKGRVNKGRRAQVTERNVGGGTWGQEFQEKGLQLEK